MSKPGPDPRAAVRVAAFEKSLEAFNVEQGQKVALALSAYHERYVSPLEERIAALESRRSWWRGWVRRNKEG